MEKKKNTENRADPAGPPRLRGWAKVFGFPKHPQSFGKYVKLTSPDSVLAVVFEPGVECSMMRYSHEFRLVNRDREIVQEFKGMSSPVQEAWWAPDSRVVGVPISDPVCGLLLYDAARRRYSMARFSPYEERVKVTSSSIRIGVDLQEFKAVFGDGFKPPRECSVRFSALRWSAVPEKGAWKLYTALRSAPKLKWQPPPSKEMIAYAREQGIELIGVK